jgi:hypothetical protein
MAWCYTAHNTKSELPRAGISFFTRRATIAKGEVCGTVGCRRLCGCKCKYKAMAGFSARCDLQVLL